MRDSLRERYRLFYVHRGVDLQAYWLAFYDYFHQAGMISDKELEKEFVVYKSLFERGIRRSSLAKSDL